MRPLKGIIVILLIAILAIYFGCTSNPDQDSSQSDEAAVVTTTTTDETTNPLSEETVDESVEPAVIIPENLTVEKSAPSADGKTYLALNFTDAPIDEAKSVKVAIKRIEIAKEDEGFFEYFVADTEDDEIEIDLLLFRNGNSLSVDSKVMEPGVYGQIRFFLSDVAEKNTITLMDDSVHNLQINNGIKNNGLKLVSGFELQEGLETQLTIDFNVRKSIVVKGGKKNPKYALKPTIKLIKNDVAAHIVAVLNNISKTRDLFYLYETGFGVSDEANATTVDDNGTPDDPSDDDTIDQPFANAVSSANSVIDPNDVLNKVIFSYTPYGTYDIYKHNPFTNELHLIKAGVSLLAGGSVTVYIDDTEAPNNPSIIINGEDDTTDSAEVTLSLSAEDVFGVSAYLVSEDGLTPSVDDTSWVSVNDKPMVLSLDVTADLSNSDGEKTVHAWFKDETGNISQVVSAYITLQTTSSYRLPDTGQAGDYTSTFGEDSDYTINPLSYTDNGDGTVTDNNTGLIWHKLDDDVDKTWDEAVSYCADPPFGESSDWRLPTIQELVNILDHSTYNPAINTVFSENDSSLFHSSTEKAGENNDSWFVHFRYGMTAYYAKTSKASVYCVRKIHNPASNFSVNNDSTVTDNKTGLVWQQAEGGKMNWESALSYCESLPFGGKDDWRLPNSKELQTVVDYTKNNPAIDKSIFIDAKSTSYFSSTTVAEYNHNAWVVHFSNGSIGYGGKSEKYNVRCVRGGKGSWTQVTASADWAARRGHRSVVYDNKMWILGGYDASEYMNDIWYSSDGSNWTQVTSSAEWSDRLGHTSLVFNNKLWIIGGLSSSEGYMNDVWYSSDGMSWIKATSSAEWTGRYSHTSVAFNNKMWLMGGDIGGNDPKKNDVWNSSDGITWNRTTDSAHWPVRGHHRSVVYNDKMWVIGGSGVGGLLNDVWNSSDGETWNPVTDAADWSARSVHGCVVFDEKIWVLGGWANSFKNDVWHSNNGITWNKNTSFAGWSARQSPISNVFNKRIWVFGGYDSTGEKNDVWYLE